MGKFYDNLTDFQKHAVDWHAKVVFSGDTPHDHIGGKPLNMLQRERCGIRIIQPDLYRNDLREFFACDAAEVADLESIYRDHLAKQRKQPDAGTGRRNR